jgi:hypothetical protein
MSNAQGPSRAERRRVVVPLFLALLLAYAYGAQNPFNVNAVSRMALAVCLATEGRVAIEPFHEDTVDRAFRDGRWYSDKAPGLSFAAVPVVAAVVAATGGGSPDELRASPLRFGALTLVAAPLLNGVATALAACALYLLARRLGRERRQALVAAIAFALATPAWGWASAFYGHALSGALAFLAFALAVSRLEEARKALPGWIAVGLLLGYAVLTEYPLVVPAAIVAGIAAVGARRYGATGRVVLGIAAGAAGPAIALLAYNRAVSGSWWSLPYAQVVGFEGMRQGFMGVTYPRAEALWGILFSERRGLLWLSPVCAFVPYAFWRARRAMPSLYWGASLGIVLYFVAFNASYAYWDGGGSTGPRHLTPALAFACLPLAWAWGAERRIRAAMGAALAASFALSWACASTTMTALYTIERPLRDLVLPSLRAGEISNLSSVLAQIYPGLPFPRGHASLLPLAVLWAVAARTLLRETRPATQGAPTQAVAGEGACSLRRP